MRGCAKKHPRNCSASALQLYQLRQNFIGNRQGTWWIDMTGANDALRVDQRDRAARQAIVRIEDTQALTHLAVRVKIRQQRMVDTAKALGPDLESRCGITGKAEDFCAFLPELLQRTVEGCGLIGSSTGEGQRIRRDHNPLRTLELAQ